MYWRTWNNILIVSFSLAVAGILLCIAALLDILVPRGSTAGIVVGLAALGTLIALVVAGYAWICDRCDDYLSDYSDRLHGKGAKKRGAGAGKNGQGNSPESGVLDELQQCQRLRSLADRYAEGPRGPRWHTPPSVFARKQWHGQ